MIRTGLLPFGDTKQANRFNVLMRLRRRIRPPVRPGCVVPFGSKERKAAMRFADDG